LWYPIIVAATCFVIGMIYLTNRKKANVMEWIVFDLNMKGIGENLQIVSFAKT
jgi:hypothetical protein